MTVQCGHMLWCQNYTLCDWCSCEHRVYTLNYYNNNNFILLCLAIGTRQVLHRVGSSASSFILQYPVFSLMSSSSCLHLLRHVPITSSLPSIFPSRMYFRRQFLHKVWPIQLAFLVLSVVGYSSPLLSVTLYYFSHDQSSWSYPSFSHTTFQNFPGISDLLSRCPSFSTTQRFSLYVALYWFLP